MATDDAQDEHTPPPPRPASAATLRWRGPWTSSASAGTGSFSATLREGPAGFRELSRTIGGISDSVLSDRLSDLAEAGLIARTVDEGPPLAVSYALTDRGNALIPALEQISLWAQEHLVDDPR